MDGVLLSKQTAQRHEQAANLVLSNRGDETTQARQEIFERRGFRFYRVPTGGVAGPINATTPRSKTCTLMKWNAAGTVLSATTITETVYFFEAAQADQIVKVATIGGKNVAVGLTGENIACQFHISIGGLNGVIVNPDPVVTNFRTDDPSKFYFDGSTARTNVPCVIHYTGTYSFWPRSAWIQKTADSLFFWSGVQGRSGVGGRHAAIRRVELSTIARINEFLISLPILVNTGDPNSVGVTYPYHIPLNFTFISDDQNGSLVPTLSNNFTDWTIEWPDTDGLELDVIAMEKTGKNFRSY